MKMIFIVTTRPGIFHALARRRKKATILEIVRRKMKVLGHNFWGLLHITFFFSLFRHEVIDL